MIRLRPEINENQNYALLRNLPGKEKKCPALSKLSVAGRFLSALRAVAPVEKKDKLRRQTDKITHTLIIIQK